MPRGDKNNPDAHRNRDKSLARRRGAPLRSPKARKCSANSAWVFTSPAPVNGKRSPSNPDTRAKVGVASDKPSAVWNLS